MYTLKSKMSSLLSAEQTWEDTSAWEAAHSISCDAIVAEVPGLTSVVLELQADKRSVIRTLTYDDVDARNSHFFNDAMPTLRKPGLFAVEFIEESEETPPKPEGWFEN
ncbi:hypothetical protein N9578_00585 [bacterium]|nr:hypothetical protein [bacterium]MDB4128528.1 hypothetical protein [bacterium]